MAATISICVTALAFLFIVIGLLIGMKRGFIRSVFRLILIGLSAVLALLLSYPLSYAIADLFKDSLYEQMNKLMPSFEQLAELSPTLKSLLTVLPAAFLSLVVFILLFIVISLLSLIIYHLISSKMLNPFTRKVGGTIGGAVVGAVTGCLVLAILLAPLTGLAAHTSTALHSLSVLDAEHADLYTKMNDEFVSELNNNWFVTFVRTYGGMQLTDQLMTVEIEGKEYKISKEVNALLEGASIIQGMTSAENPTIATETSHLIHMASDTTGSDLMPQMLAEIVSGMGKKLKEDGSFFSVKPGLVSPEGKALLDGVYDLLSDTTSETVSKDLTLVSELYSLMDQYGLSDADAEKAVQVLCSTDFLPSVAALTEDTDRYQVLFDKCYDMVTPELFRQGTDSYDNVVDEAAQALNDPNGQAKIEDLIQRSAAEYGYSVDEGALHVLSEYLFSRFGGQNITAEQLKKMVEEGVQAISGSFNP